MELFRIWGIADAVRDASVACEPTMAVRRTLAAEPLAVVPLGFPSLRVALQASPELPARCPQDLIEPLLVERLRALGGQIEFGARLTGLRHDAAGSILATVGGHRVRARFVVGADGPRSRAYCCPRAPAGGSTHGRGRWPSSDGPRTGRQGTGTG